MAPQNFLHIFDYTHLRLPNNETVRRLRNDEKGQLNICRALANIGITRFTPLIHEPDNARIALPMYAGSGIVVKIIPDDHSDSLIIGSGKNGRVRLPRLLPSITMQEVETSGRPFKIKTYPWIDQKTVGDSQIEEMRPLLEQEGLQFRKGDDKARNICRLPDLKGTLTGLDSDMYALSGNARVKSARVEEWMKHIYRVFPIYLNRVVPPQTPATNFKFVSLATPDPRRHAFGTKPSKANEIAKKTGFLSRFF